MIEITQMTQDHIQALAQMEKLCFQDPWSLHAFAYELNNPLSLWLVALNEADQVVGYVGSQSVIDAADIMNVAVLPEYRCQGIATALLEAICHRLAQKGMKTVTLEVRCSNDPAISLYQRLGFRQVGLRKNYYRNPKEDALILQKEIV